MSNPFEGLTPEQKAEKFSDMIDSMSDRIEDLEALLEECCECIVEQQLLLRRNRLDVRFTKKYAGMAVKIHTALGGPTITAPGSSANN